MNERQSLDIMEATRLTRLGRLDEAMTAIRSALRPGRASSFDSSSTRNPTEISTITMPPALDALARIQGPPCNNSPSSSKLECSPRTIAPLRGLLAKFKQINARKTGDRLGLAGAVARPPLPDGARFEQRVFTNESGSRAYKVYIPSWYSGQPLPLVVMMHGCTQSPDDFAAGTRFNELAELQDFIVAYPEQPQSANPSKCWNWFKAADQQRGCGEPSLIAGITRQVIHDWAIDPKRVYIAGLSAGGAAASVMGTVYPDLFTAIGVHSGLTCGAATNMASAFAAMRQGGAPITNLRGYERGIMLPTIVFHGDRDTTVHPTNADQIIAQAKSGADIRSVTTHGQIPDGLTFTRTVEADESGRTMLEQWTVHGAGHAWSGGSTNGSYTEPRGPDASREMIRFFLQHAKESADEDPRCCS